MLEIDVSTTNALFTEETMKACVLCRRLVETDGVRGPVDITEDFNLEGLVHVYLVFGWDDPSKKGGRRRIEFHWVTKGSVVARTESTLDFHASPVWFSGCTPAICLGQGDHAVQVLVDGDLVVEKPFRIRKF